MDKRKSRGRRSRRYRLSDKARWATTTIISSLVSDWVGQARDHTHMTSFMNDPLAENTQPGRHTSLRVLTSQIALWFYGSCMYLCHPLLRLLCLPKSFIFVSSCLETHGNLSRFCIINQFHTYTIWSESSEKPASWLVSDLATAPSIPHLVIPAPSIPSLYEWGGG